MPDLLAAMPTAALLSPSPPSSPPVPALLVESFEAFLAQELKFLEARVLFKHESLVSMGRHESLVSLGRQSESGETLQNEPFGLALGTGKVITRLDHVAAPGYDMSGLCSYISAVEEPEMGYIPSSPRARHVVHEALAGRLSTRTMDSKYTDRPMRDQRSVDSQPWASDDVVPLKTSSGMHFPVRRSSVQGTAAEFGKLRPKGRWGTMQDFVLSPPFEAAAFLNVIVNIILVGLHTNYTAQNLRPEPPFSYILAEALCCCLFIIEVALRLVVNSRLFLFGPGRLLNTLDLALVMCQVAELVVTVAVTDRLEERKFNFAVIRGLRLARLVRLLRSVRFFSSFAEIRGIALSIVVSVRPLCPACGFLLFMMYIFSLVFMEMIIEERIALAPGVEKAVALRESFGSVGASVYTLFTCVTNGVEWKPAANLLPGLGRNILFPLFIVWTTLGMFNIITAAFVEGMSPQIREDASDILYSCAEAELKKHCMPGTNVIKMEKVKEALGAEPTLKRQLHLSSTDIEKLFKLFDHEGDGFLDVDDMMAKIRVVAGGARRLEQELSLLSLHDLSELGQSTASVHRRPSIIQEDSNGSFPSLPGVLGEGVILDAVCEEEEEEGKKVGLMQEREAKSLEGNVAIPKKTKNVEFRSVLPPSAFWP